MTYDALDEFAGPGGWDRDGGGRMTIPGLTCATCHQPISGARGASMAYPTDEGLVHVNCPRSNNSDWIAERNRARAEDLSWMAETGETQDGAAARLGVTRSSLREWCRDHAPDLWADLAANEGARAGVIKGGLDGGAV